MFIFVSQCEAVARTAFGGLYILDHYDFTFVREKMAEGALDDFYLVETILATVHSDKIPKLIEFMIWLVCYRIHCKCVHERFVVCLLFHNLMFVMSRQTLSLSLNLK